MNIAKKHDIRSIVVHAASNNVMSDNGCVLRTRASVRDLRRCALALPGQVTVLVALTRALSIRRCATLSRERCRGVTCPENSHRSRHTSAGISRCTPAISRLIGVARSRRCPAARAVLLARSERRARIRGCMLSTDITVERESLIQR